MTWFRNLRFVAKAPLVGAMVASFLLIPPYVLLFVWGRHPHGDTAWGWRLDAVLSGVIVGILVGSFIGGAIGLVVGVIGEAGMFLMGRKKRNYDTITKPGPSIWDNDLDT
jgi:hypothetical protein